MLGPGKKDGEIGGLGERKTITTRKTTLIYNSHGC
jgi:hypothetical protein